MWPKPRLPLFAARMGWQKNRVATKGITHPFRVRRERAGNLSASLTLYYTARVNQVLRVRERRRNRSTLSPEQEAGETPKVNASIEAAERFFVFGAQVYPTPTTEDHSLEPQLNCSEPSAFTMTWCTSFFPSRMLFVGRELIARNGRRMPSVNTAAFCRNYPGQRQVSEKATIRPIEEYAVPS